MSPELSDVQRRERDHYDRHAAGLDPAGPFPAAQPTDAVLLDALGDVGGRRVLELGCGAGDVTLALAARGAHVTALDVAPALLAVARERVERAGLPPVEFVARPAEDSGLDPDAFDVVCGKWVLHHIDLEAGVPELARVLAPGGRGVFFENWGGNPVLRWAREEIAGRPRAPMVGTPDEHALDERDVALLARSFATARATFPTFYAAQLADRVLLGHRHRATHAAARGLDGLVWRLAPPLRRFSWHAVIEVTA